VKPTRIIPVSPCFFQDYSAGLVDCDSEVDTAFERTCFYVVI